MFLSSSDGIADKFKLNTKKLELMKTGGYYNLLVPTLPSEKLIRYPISQSQTLEGIKETLRVKFDLDPERYYINIKCNEKFVTIKPGQTLEAEFKSCIDNYLTDKIIFFL